MAAPERKPVELPIEKNIKGKEYLNLSNLRHGFERQEALLDYLNKKQIPNNPLIRDKYLTYTLKKDATVSYWEDYYSGCDVGVLIGDVWVDDIITIQYTLTNNKSPIYGYISEEFDAVAKGTRIVQGQFAIAFKEVNYLNRILEAYEKKYIKLKSGRILTEDEIVEYKETGKLPRGLSEFEKNFTEEEINVIAGGFKSPDKYGEVLMPFGGTKIRRDGFDIIVSFGDISQAYRGGTVEFINGCHITSRSLVCEPTGEPIAEMYSFFARALNKYVPKFRYNILQKKEGEEETDAKLESETTEGEEPISKIAEPEERLERYIELDIYEQLIKSEEYGTKMDLKEIIELYIPVMMAGEVLLPAGKYAIVMMDISISDIGHSSTFFRGADTSTRRVLDTIETDLNIMDNKRQTRNYNGMLPIVRW